MNNLIMNEVFNLKFLSEYLNIKLLLITISVTIAYLFSISENNLIIKRKY